MDVYVIFLGLLFLSWLVFLTVSLIKMKAHYFHLTASTGKKKIDEILDSLIEGQKKLQVDFKDMRAVQIREIEKAARHLQYVGLVRFNPFGTVGGEQSFVVALMDEEESGLILNFIYTKEGLRVYTKRVKKGVGVEYELSNEEVKAIKKSKQNFNS